MISTTADETRRACAPRVRLVTVKQLRGELKGSPVRMPHAAARHAREFLEGEDREHFLVLHLDSKHQVVSIEVASIGTLSSSLVHPREVFKGAILANAAAVICAHNHPSGNVEPSTDDREVLILRHVEQLSVAEVAQIMGATEGAVKVRRLRALQALRRKMNEFDGGPSA